VNSEIFNGLFRVLISYSLSHSKIFFFLVGRDIKSSKMFVLCLENDCRHKK